MDADLLNLRENVLPEIVDGLNKKFPFAHALVMRRTAEGIEADSRAGTVQANQGELYRKYGWDMNLEGVTLTAWSGDQVHEVSTHDISPDAIATAAKKLHQYSHSDLPFELDLPEFQRVDFSTRVKTDALGVSVAGKISAVKELERRILAVPTSHKVVATTEYQHTLTQEIFVGPHLSGAQELQHGRLRAFLYISDGDTQKMNYFKVGGLCSGLDMFDVSDEVLEETIREGGLLLNPVAKPTGPVPIIVSESYGGLIAHESFGHGREGDTVTHQIARARHKVGEQVGSPLVTLVTDPTELGLGQYAFDHEGIIAKRYELVSGGIITPNTITDFHSARMGGLTPTAHGRRQAPAHAIYSRQSWTGFQPIPSGEEGSMTFEEMISDIDFGVYVKRSAGGMEDPHGWTIQCDALYGVIIRNGKLTDEVVEEPKIDTTVPLLLGAVRGVTSNLYLDSGACGKFHKELVPVGDGGAKLYLHPLRLA